MDEELLEKEKHYHKLNEELEIKTKELMKEVENVCEKFNLKFTGQKCESRVDKIDKELCYEETEKSGNLVNDNDEKLLSSKSSDEQKNYKDNKVCTEIIDPNYIDENSFDNCDNFSYLLQTKVNMLQSELHEVRELYLNKVKELTNLQFNYKKLEKEVIKIKTSSSKVNESKNELKKNYEIIYNKLGIYEAENKFLKKEVESLKMTLNHTKKRDAIQLKQLLEEIERLNGKLTAVSKGGKQTRKDYIYTNGECVNKNLYAQKSEAMLLMKKQLQLISNLKKQKHILEIVNPLKFSETKFLSIFNFD